MATSLPDGGVSILLLALLIKAVDLCDLSRFVIAADEDDSVRVSKAALVSRVIYIVMLNSTYFAFRHMSNVNVSKLK